MDEPLPSKIGKYPVVREIGRGGTSRVYLGRDPFANRDVAIKVVSAADGIEADLRRRFHKVFLNEASLVGKLIHPHIMGIYDADAFDEYSYIVMEYVDGPTLEHFCDVANLLPVDRVVEIAFKCSLALDFAHRHGIIHRDIKPANILVGAQGDIKISDFGVALQAGGEHTHLQGVGSPAYMSPEQVQDKELSHQTDIYSLGVVLYQLLAGKLPFIAANKASLLYQILNIEPPPPSTHRTDIPAQLDKVVMRALTKDPRQRFQTWGEFSRELTQTYRHLELPPDSISDTEKFNAIKALAFFKGFRDVEVWETVRIATFRRIQPDKVVIREGDVGENFYVIASGEAQVSKGANPLDRLEAGDCFGEILYFEGTKGKRITTIASITPLTVIEIKALALQKASDACQKQFNQAFLRILIERLSVASDRLSTRG
ncbi:MAG TPA: serine/threonine-protein kinase [Burkholderiales bacterium]|nr:serine/threonine-protein kinase [Burkholderiales bacterium]